MTTLTKPQLRIKLSKSFLIQPATHLFFLILLIFWGVYVTDSTPNQTDQWQIIHKGETIHPSNFPLMVNDLSNFSINLPRSAETAIWQIDMTSNNTVALYHRGKIKPKLCNQDSEPSKQTCHYVFQQGNTSAALFVHKSKTLPLIIDAIQLTKVKTKQQSIPMSGELQLALLIVLLMLPVIWLVHQREVMSQWLIIGISTTALMIIQWQFTLFLLVFLSAIFFWAKQIPKSKRKQQSLWVCLFLSVLFLAIFKYGKAWNDLFFYEMSYQQLWVPLGLSYFIIRVIDTILRAYRNELQQITFRQYLCFVIFPCTIPAGPIETIHGFISKRLSTIQAHDISYGFGRIFIGIFKKIVIADLLLGQYLLGSEGQLYSITLSPESASQSEVFVMLWASLLFVYIDFSAYSDIAIGLSRLYGYQVMENFTWPILAQNIRLYWQSWHRSLSSWCMRNIYLPLAISTRNPYLPFYAVMLAVGLWHAWNLSWFFWAIHHATGLSFMFWLEQKKPLPKLNHTWLKPLKIFITLSYIAAGHSFAQIHDFDTAWRVYLKFWGLG